MKIYFGGSCVVVLRVISLNQNKDVEGFEKSYYKEKN